MKKFFLIMLAAAPLLFSSCGGEDVEKEAALKKADSLQALVNAKDGEIDALFEVLNEIETSMSDISARYNKVNALKQGNPEMGTRLKGQIADQLTEIDELLAQNKKRIAALNSKAAELGAENSKLQEFIENLNLRIESQEQQINELTNELNLSKATIKQLSQNVTDLTQANQEKDDYIAYQTNEANKAYYIVGSFNELKDMGIVNKSGGFVGIGKKQNTTTEMDISKFQTIDRTKVTTITVNMKKAQVVSKHPEGSYEMVYDENNKKTVAYLVIKDVNAFWRYTDYLVISSK